MSPKKLVVGAGIATALLSGGAVAASDYPPDVPPSTTVLATSDGGAVPQDPQGTPQGFERPTTPLPNTGSDTGNIVVIAGGALVAGAGLLLVARRRRQPAAS